MVIKEVQLEYADIALKCDRFLRVGRATNEQVPRSPTELRPVWRHHAAAGRVLHDGYGGNEACFLRVRTGQKRRRTEAHRNRVGAL